MRAPLPLMSAIGFLVAAGALMALVPPWGAIAAAVLVVVAVLLLRDRDEQIASEVSDDMLDLVHWLTAYRREEGAPE